MKASEFFKHILLVATCLVGFCAFLIMAGEEDPCEPMPAERFFLMKLAALLVFFLCFLFGKFCVRNNLFPKSFIEDMREDGIEGQKDIRDHGRND